MRPGCWLGLMLCVFCSAFTLMVGWQVGHPIPLIPRGSILKQAEEDDPRANWKKMNGR